MEPAFNPQAGQGRGKGGSEIGKVQNSEEVNIREGERRKK
jgi:hypothetical protein